MLIVTTTAPYEETARQIAKALVESRLAACVQVSGPITSVYRWQGAVETNQEWLCTAKTTEACWPGIERLVAEHHPYDTPELIATPITHVSSAYGAWLQEAVGEAGGTK